MTTICPFVGGLLRERSDYDQEFSLYYQGHPTHREIEPHTDKSIDDLYRPS